MPTTWENIRKEALTLLDVNPNATTSDDIRNAVDYRMKHVRDRLYNRRPPRSLMVTSDPLTITSSAEYVSISEADNSPTQPSFALTDFRKLFTLSVQGEDWDQYSWEAWKRTNSAVAGDQRYSCSFTLDANNRIYLKTTPNVGETWDLELTYMKEPGVISDAGVIELAPEHEELLVLGVVIGFPNRFQTVDRLALYTAFRSHYNELYKDFESDLQTLKSGGRLRPMVRRRDVSSVNWGNGETF